MRFISSLSQASGTEMNTLINIKGINSLKKEKHHSRFQVLSALVNDMHSYNLT